MIRFLFCFIFFSFFHLSAFSKEDLLKSTVGAKLVTVDVQGKETHSDVQTVKPGDIVEYILHYENVSDGPLKDLKIIGPIPSGTVYVEDSVTQDVTKHIEVSLDNGKSWTDLPAYRIVKTADGKEEKIKVKMAEYRQLKWHVSDPLPQKGTLDFKFRVKVQ